MSQRFQSPADMKKYAQKYSVSLHSAAGRMYLCCGILLISAYAGKWFVNRNSHLDAGYPVAVGLAILTMALPFWPLAYVRKAFPFIYRYCVLSTRAQNASFRNYYVRPVLTLAFVAWLFLVVFRYMHWMLGFFDTGNIKPYIALVSGEFAFMLFGVTSWAQITAHRRGVILKRQNFLQSHK